MNRFSTKVADHLDRLGIESLRRNYRQLANEVGFFESVFNSLTEGVMVAGADAKLVYANGAAERLLGFSFIRLEGHRISEVLPELDWQHILEISAEGKGWAKKSSRAIELTYPERRIVEIDSMPSPQGNVILVRDITLEREREADAVESGRTDAVKDLAAGVAHEIGNPLNALSLNLQLLARTVSREDFAKHRQEMLADIQIAQNELKRMDGIIRSFLAALRPAKLNLVPGSPADALMDAMAAMRQQISDRSITVSIDLPPALPPVMIDRAQMEQVFFNLVKNSLEAMKDGCSLYIDIACDDAYVSVSIRDEGAGMSDETLAHLFEPYRTTKSKGTGLGLMLSQRIVRAHGGEIDVESKEGEGSRFTVRLPRVSRRVRELS